jgi:GMP synthase (glutamine-hydrolysing)
MGHQLVLVIDFGGQYNHLLARRVRECGVYCEVVSHTIPAGEVAKRNPIGIIFTGGPNSVYGEGAPCVDRDVFELGIPILGLCYGIQHIAHVLGGHVQSTDNREYGRTETTVVAQSPLFEGMGRQFVSWMSHTDYVDTIPPGYLTTATTASCPIAAMENPAKRIYGLQFHPEVSHTRDGARILHNFLFGICGAKGDWTMQDYAVTAVAEIRRRVGDKQVLLALSGGVDSSVAARLIAQAVGRQLTCIFVDHGLMRKNEGDEIEAVFGEGELNFIRVDAGDRFLSRLEGVSDPEQKRRIIGEEFIRVFEEEGKKIGSVDYLAQGTIYPDVVESGVGDGAVIKSHHNVGGLPDFVDFTGIIEPLRMLFKDEVRALGEQLGLPESLVWRQPFPGPGLAIRIIGGITRERLAMLREADAIFREEISHAGLARDINQYFAVLTDMRSVGVMGDGRTYDYTLALRGVTTTDFMTADWARIPFDLLERISGRIVNEVRGINRIVYDITSKPPATIEWE